jgi:hypothetical protein
MSTSSALPLDDLLQPYNPSVDYTPAIPDHILRIVLPVALMLIMVFALFIMYFTFSRVTDILPSGPTQSRIIELPQPPQSDDGLIVQINR